MSSVTLAQAVINGLLVGSLYSVMAIGLTIIFGVMRVINMAHGEFIMLGMYLAYWLHTAFAATQGEALVLVLPVFMALGVTLQRGVVERVARQGGEMGTLLVTAGLSLVLANTAQLLWTADFRALPSSYTTRLVQYFGLSVNAVLVQTFGVAVLLTAATYAFLVWTDSGRAIRATSQDPMAAALMGVDVGRIKLVAFGVGTVLAAMAGALLTPIFYVYPYVGRVFIVKSFVVVVLGGMGSVLGATVGGIILGLVEAVGSLFISSGYREALGLVIFLLVLVFRPTGLFVNPRL